MTVRATGESDLDTLSEDVRMVPNRENDERCK
ncbi:hypothetical protein PC128_g6739 [Phytophthora cactorum]|nr:hypothetical protein PC128_g6739 [Phytophthora cactorum]